MEWRVRQKVCVCVDVDVGCDEQTKIFELCEMISQHSATLLTLTHSTLFCRFEVESGERERRRERESGRPPDSTAHTQDNDSEAERENKNIIEHRDEEKG